MYHPSHTTNVNHTNIQNQQHFPTSESVVNEVTQHESWTCTRTTTASEHRWSWRISRICCWSIPGLEQQEDTGQDGRDTLARTRNGNGTRRISWFCSRCISGRQENLGLDWVWTKRKTVFVDN